MLTVLQDAYMHVMHACTHVGKQGHKQPAFCWNGHTYVLTRAAFTGHKSIPQHTKEIFQFHSIPAKHKLKSTILKKTTQIHFYSTLLFLRCTRLFLDSGNPEPKSFSNVAPSSHNSNAICPTS